MKDVKVVPLETMPQSLIGNFSVVVYLDDKNIICRSDNKILIFDAGGKYVSKIDASGKGPGECTTINNVYVDPVEELIYVVEDSPVIHVFNYHGKFIKTTRIPFLPGGIFRALDGRIIAPCIQFYNEQNRDMLYVLNNQLNISHTFKSRNPDWFVDIKQDFRFLGNPYEVDGRILYKEPFNDTIYEVAENALKVHWIISTGGKSLKTKDGINIDNRQIASKDKIGNLVIRESTGFFFFE